MGMPVHNVELVPGKGGQICRAAGCVATIVNKQTEHAIVRLPSGVKARGAPGRGASSWGAGQGGVCVRGRAVAACRNARVVSPTCLWLMVNTAVEFALFAHRAQLTAV